MYPTWSFWRGSRKGVEVSIDPHTTWTPSNSPNPGPAVNLKPISSLSSSLSFWIPGLPSRNHLEPCLSTFSAILLVRHLWPNCFRQFKPISRWWENGDFRWKKWFLAPAGGWAGPAQCPVASKSDHLIRFPKPTMATGDQAGQKSNQCQKYIYIIFSPIW